MSDEDLIRRGDALAEIRRIFGGLPNWVADAIAALPAVAVVPIADVLKVKTELRQAQERLAALEPVAAPDPAAIREAALREVLDILESHGAAGEAIAFEVAALIPKKGYDAPREAALLADLAQGPMRGELMEPWIRRMMNRAAALISKGDTDEPR